MFLFPIDNVIIFINIISLPLECINFNGKVPKEVDPSSQKVIIVSYNQASYCKISVVGDEIDMARVLNLKF